MVVLQLVDSLTVTEGSTALQVSDNALPEAAIHEMLFTALDQAKV